MFPTNTNDYYNCTEYTSFLSDTQRKINLILGHSTRYLQTLHYSSSYKQDSGMISLLNAVLTLETCSSSDFKNIYSNIIFSKYAYSAEEINELNRNNNSVFSVAELNLACDLANDRRDIDIVHIPKNFDLFIETIQQKYEWNKAHLQSNGYTNSQIVDEMPKTLTALENVYKLDEKHKIKVFKCGNTFKIYTNKILHTLEYKILGTLPLLFNDKQLSEDFTSICIAIGTQNLDALITSTDKFLKNKNLKQIAITRTFQNCTIGDTAYQINRQKEQIYEYQEQIKEYEGYVKNALDSIRNCTERIIVLKHTDTSEQKQTLIDFLTKCPYILATQANSRNNVTMFIEAPVTNWDPNAFEKVVIDNRSDRDSDFYIWLLEQIFIKETITMYYYNQVSINFSNNGIAAVRVYDQYKCLANPHLEYFNCWGNNKTQAMKYLSEARYEEAITQIIATVGMMNFFDSTVVNYFKTDLRSLTEHKQSSNYKDTKFTDTKTGELYTITQLYEKYKEETTNG